MVSVRITIKVYRVQVELKIYWMVSGTIELWVVTSFIDCSINRIVTIIKKFRNPCRTSFSLPTLIYFIKKKRRWSLSGQLPWALPRQLRSISFFHPFICIHINVNLYIFFSSKPLLSVQIFCIILGTNSVNTYKRNLFRLSIYSQHQRIKF